MNPSIRNPKKTTPRPNIVKLLIMNKEEILKAARKKKLKDTLTTYKGAKLRLIVGFSLKTMQSRR